MPIPLIPIAVALCAGGSLVPHAAGGLIVTGATGYIAGTYISTAAVASVIAAAGGGVLTAAAVGASTVIGSAGIMGSQLGATGATGALMAAGILPSTPVIVPVALIAAGVLGACSATYFALRRGSLARRVYAASKKGEEVVFTETEAKLVARLFKILYKKGRLPKPDAEERGLV